MAGREASWENTGKKNLIMGRSCTLSRMFEALGKLDVAYWCTTSPSTGGAEGSIRSSRSSSATWGI